mmetsp:Transcript_14148/g.59851  ORF Transcript_14148/g.59851 Transcript_14148/m.59851 type:complete len:271 (+) Transcript_14148:4224-5036(+)
MICILEGLVTFGHSRERPAEFQGGARLASGGPASCHRRPNGGLLARLQLSLRRPPTPSFLRHGHGLRNVDVDVGYFGLPLRRFPIVPIFLNRVLLALLSRGACPDNLRVLHAVAQILATLLPDPRLNLHRVIAGVKSAHGVVCDGAVTESALDARSAAALLANRARERVPFLVDVADAHHWLHRLDVVYERLRHPLRTEEMAPFAVSRGFQRPTGRRAQAALRRPLGRILLLEDASLAVPVAGGYPHDAVAPLVHRNVARLAEKNGVIFV